MNQFTQNVLVQSAQNGNISKLNYLISQGGKINGYNSDGYAAVHAAAAKSSVYTLEYLQNLDGDINLKDAYGNTPLHYAINFAANDIAEWLILEKADVLQKNARGKSALDLAKKSIGKVSKQVRNWLKDEIEEQEYNKEEDEKLTDITFEIIKKEEYNICESFCEEFSEEAADEIQTVIAYLYTQFQELKIEEVAAVAKGCTALRLKNVEEEITYVLKNLIKIFIKKAPKRITDMENWYEIKECVAFEINNLKI